MPIALSPGVAVVVIALTIALLFVPGLLTAAALGLRGWLLAASAPLITYASVGIAGPWLAIAGIPFTVTTFVLAVLVIVAACAGIGLLHRRRAAMFRWSRGDDAGSPWQHTAHIAVLGCVLAAAAIGGYTVLSGMGSLATIPQDWDAAYHANGIRYIAESHDSSLIGMGALNKYGDGTALFYPNAYHLVGTLVYQLSGVSIAAVLNAHAVLLPGLLALALVAMIRQFRGRAVFAGFTALLVIAPVTLLYASLERGPLLTFLTGLALLPVGIAALRRLLTHPGLATAAVSVLVLIGLLAIHPSTLFTGLVFGVPLLVQHWLTTRPQRMRARTIATDLVALGGVAAMTALLAAPHLIGALTRPSPNGPVTWPADLDIQGAAGALLVFQHDQPLPQLWLGAALLLGLVLIRRLGELRWLGATALLTSLAWIVVSTSDAPTVIALSQPLWNDPWRFMALAALPLTVLAAHGLAESQAMARPVAMRVADRIAAGVRRGVASIRHGNGDASVGTASVPRAWVAGGLAVAVLAGFAGVTGLFYTAPNATVVGKGYDMDVSERVSTAEVAAMRKLGELAAPGEWAMNDRFDGTVWTYAISGVRTVAAHYDKRRAPSEARLLSQRFKDYGTSPAVRAAAAELNVRWLIIGKRGFVREEKRRIDGLTGHAALPFLTKVYENDGAVIYRLDRMDTPYEFTSARLGATPTVR
ncbi:DUF6541 family protein [Haloechinothrix halophila]|uniref:DUF6541 family protein n=1 Tax=Haloechinothrix halophila TaxID=1069073 RepID=UPI00041D626F|nr:DUF6541 family protein [Haloechinothrix halophila]